MDAYKIKAKIFSYTNTGLHVDLPIADCVDYALLEDIMSPIEAFIPSLLAGEMEMWR